MSKVDSTFTFFMDTEEAKTIKDQIAETKDQIMKYDVWKTIPYFTEKGLK